MHHTPSAIGVEFADPWLRTERPPLPGHLRLIVAYRALERHAVNHHALFADESGPYPGVWLAIAPDLSDVLIWTGDDGLLAEEGLALLHRLSPERFGRALELAEPYLLERHYRQVLRLLLYTRHREENPGGAVSAGALSADAYDEVACELYSQALLERLMHMGFFEANPSYRDGAGVTLEPGEAAYAHLASSPAEKHALALREDGSLACYWCGERTEDGDIRRALVETCGWKTLLAEKRREDRKDIPLPERLSRLRESRHRLYGEALLGALRLWYGVAPFSTSQCRGMTDERSQFLSWAIGGRVREVLAALDRTGQPRDRRVAALIREMATWKPVRGGGGLGRVHSSITWGFVGRELNDPAWRDPSPLPPRPPTS